MSNAMTGKRMHRPNTYLVTGAAGFIGACVARLLLRQGNRVVGVDNLNDYYDVRLKEHRLTELRGDGFTFHPLDIEDRDALESLFERTSFDAILNLAARAGVRYSVENPHVYFTTNVMGNLNLLELARHHGVKKYILASTSSLYAGQPTPFVESLPVNEPISPYAASKKAAEVTCYTYHHLFQLDISLLRFFTVYGPAGRPDMSIFRFVRGIARGETITVYGSGEQGRDFTYVDDIAHGVIAALRPVGFEIFNLGGGRQPTSVNQLIQLIEQQLGCTAHVRRLPAHAADMDVTWADITKAGQCLDWTPETSLADGLQATVAWYQAHQDFVDSIAL